MAMKNKRSKSSSKVTAWFVVGFLVLGTVGTIVAGVTSSGAPSGAASPAFTSTTTSDITASDWSQGNKNAKVSVIEYGDFQCPACGAYYPTVKKLIADYGDRVLFVFRNFPLYQVHQDAGISAQAVEAAGLQGKYWEMFDTVYEKQAIWSGASADIVVKQYFDGYASSIGLDVAKFDKDIDSNQVKNKITADVTSANAAQVDHTPTFFVNLKQISNPANYDEFKTVLDAALKAS